MGSGDAAFSTLATFILKDHYKRHPSYATDLGIHTYDMLMDDPSKQAIDDETAEMTSFKQELEKIDAATLTPERQLDLEQLRRAMDAGNLANSVVRTWTKDPDFYIPRFGWVRDGVVWATVLNRAQNQLDLYFVDASSGKSRRVLSEKSDTWIETDNNLQFLKSGDKFTWPSWRDASEVFGSAATGNMRSATTVIWSGTSTTSISTP